MAEEKNTNKFITIVLVLIITIAAITLLYVNLPKEENDDKDDKDDTDGPNDNATDDELILTMSYNGETKEYNLSMIEDFPTYTDYGGMIKTGWFPDIVTEGPFNYTGVKLTTLFEDFNNLPDTYNISVLADDGRSSNFTYEEINGNVKIYNGTTNESYKTGGATAILAYKKEGEYLGESEGPLRVVFLSNNDYTSSKLWAKYVVTIEIL